MTLVGLAVAAMLIARQARGQEPEVRQELLARGAPPAFAAEVAEIVATARAEGLPTAPLTHKALEGWAKRGRVPPDRVVAVLEGLAGRLRAGRDAAKAAGLAAPPGIVVAAAAEALGRGMTAAEVGELITAAPTPEAAAHGLTVAASLAAQGLERAATVKAVRDALSSGQPPERVLELPSAVANLIARGVPMAEVARQILQGGGLPPAVPGVGVGGGRPTVVPPGGPLKDLPVKDLPIRPPRKP